MDFTSKMSMIKSLQEKKWEKQSRSELGKIMSTVTDLKNNIIQQLCAVDELEQTLKRRMKFLESRGYNMWERVKFETPPK